MAKKKKGSDLGKILGYVVAVLGLVAVCMVFVKAVTTGEDGVSYTGLQVAFGKSSNDVAVLNFSFMALLPVILAVAGTVLAVLNALKNDSKLLNFVTAGLFIAAGVLYFIMPSFIVFAETIPGGIAKLLEYKLAAGAIVGAICSIFAGLVALAKPFVK